MPTNPLTRNSQLAAAPGMAGCGQQPGELGFIAWTQDASTIVPGGNTGVAGTLAWRRLALPPGPTLITTLFCHISTAAVGATAGQCFACLADGVTGALLGITADLSTALGSLGLLSANLVAPALADCPFVYVGSWWNAATSGPQWSGGRNTDVNIVNGPSALVPAAVATSVTGQTGLTTGPPTAISFAGLTRAALKPWWAVA